MFDATRRSDGGGGARNRDGLAAPSRVHVDYTLKSGQQRVRDFFGEAEEERLAKAGARILQANVWRPIRGRRTLASRAGRRHQCPARGPGRQRPDLSGPGRRDLPPRLQSRAALVLRAEDGARRGTADQGLGQPWGPRRFTPHSAFELPETPADAGRANRSRCARWRSSSPERVARRFPQFSPIPPALPPTPRSRIEGREGAGVLTLTERQRLIRRTAAEFARASWRRTLRCATVGGVFRPTPSPRWPSKICDRDRGKPARRFASREIFAHDNCIARDDPTLHEPEQGRDRIKRIEAVEECVEKQRRGFVSRATGLQSTDAVGATAEATRLTGLPPSIGGSISAPRVAPSPRSRD